MAGNPRILQIVEAFGALKQFIDSEPALHEFAIPMKQLEGVGKAVLSGDTTVPTVVHNPKARIPTRDLATNVLTLVNAAPGPSDDEEPKTETIIATLHANLARAVVYAILRDYPELMRSAPDEPDVDPKASGGSPERG